MTTHHAARASGGPWMRNPASNNTPEDIIDDPDESPMAELLKVVLHLLGRASLEELIQLPDLLEDAAKNLAAFAVQEASKLKRELARQTKEILKLEGLI
ncbi:hypothetical protein AMTR_s00159p00080040 [Amborella trichopoda]|uniref:Uncharacterized protein n=1 Tax=Amborella trichopoda TaxID=13333 RepID=W1PQ20_AMBTC|nr:hypothetical protein AMTR_s00159p00080040 [Amborella trichopoda]